MKTTFNKDKIVIFMKEGNEGYKFFKESFEKWVKFNQITKPNLEHLKKHIIESGYQVLDIFEED